MTVPGRLRPVFEQCVHERDRQHVDSVLGGLPECGPVDRIVLGRTSGHRVVVHRGAARLSISGPFDDEGRPVVLQLGPLGPGDRPDLLEQDDRGPLDLGLTEDRHVASGERGQAVRHDVQTQLEPHRRQQVVLRPDLCSTSLEEGDVLPDIILPNSHARLVQFSTYVSDCRQVLLFCPDPRLAASRCKLKNIAAQFERLKALAMLFGITNTNPEENAAFLAQDPLPFPLLSDLERQVAKGLGITHNLDNPVSRDGGNSFSMVVDIFNFYYSQFFVIYQQGFP